MVLYTKLPTVWLVLPGLHILPFFRGLPLHYTLSRCTHTHRTLPFAHPYSALFPHSTRGCYLLYGLPHRWFHLPLPLRRAAYAVHGSSTFFTGSSTGTHAGLPRPLSSWLRLTAARRGFATHLPATGCTCLRLHITQHTHFILV